jgi:hypothetical protein
MSHLIPNNNVRDLDQTYLDYTSRGFYKSFGNIKKISESSNSLLFSNEDGSLFIDGVIIKIKTDIAYSKYFLFKQISGSWKSAPSSWHTELGIFPSNIIIGISNDHVDIFDYDNLSIGYWMRFTNAANNILNTIPLKIHFANSILTIYSENTFYWIDFATENIYKTTTIDAQYNGTISQRNSALSYINLSSGVFPNISSIPKFFHGCKNYGVLGTASAGFRLNYATKTIQKLVNQECFICSIDDNGNSLFKSSTNITGTYERIASYDSYCNNIQINHNDENTLESFQDENKLAYLNFGKISTIAALGINPKIKLVNSEGYWTSDRQGFSIKTGLDYRYGTDTWGGGAAMNPFKQWCEAAVEMLDMLGSSHYVGLHADNARVIKINHTWGHTYKWQSWYRQSNVPPITGLDYYYDLYDDAKKRGTGYWDNFILNDLIQNDWSGSGRKVLLLATQYGTYSSSYYISLALLNHVVIIVVDPRNPGEQNNDLKAIAEGSGGAYLNNPTTLQVQQTIRNLFDEGLTGGFVGVHQILEDWQSSSVINVCSDKPDVQLGNLEKEKQMIDSGIAHTKDAGIDFITGSLAINSLSQYPISNGEVCHSTLGGTLSVTDWDKIDTVSITDNIPINTEIKYLISFNGGTNWKYFTSKTYDATDYDYLNFQTTDSELIIDDTPFLPSPPNPVWTPNPWFGWIHLKETAGVYEINNYHFTKMITSWDPTSFSTQILNEINPFNLKRGTIGSNPNGGTSITDNSINILYLVSFNDGSIYGYWDISLRSWQGLGTSLEIQDFIDHGMTLEQLKNIPKYAWKQYSQSPYKIRLAVAVKAFSTTQAPTFQGATVEYYANTTGWLNVSNLENDITTNGMLKTTIEGLTWQDWSDYINQGTFDLAMNLKTTDNLTTPDWTKIEIVNNSVTREFNATVSANIQILSGNKIKVESNKVSLLAENITTYDNQWLLFKTTNFIEMKAGDIAKTISIMQNQPSNTFIGYFFSFDDFTTYSYADLISGKWEWNSFSGDPKTQTANMMTATEIVQLVEESFGKIRDLGFNERFDMVILLRTDDNTKVPLISSINVIYRELEYLGHYSYSFIGTGGWEINSFNVEIPITSGDETKFDKGIILYTPNGGVRVYSREAGASVTPKFIVDLPGDTNTLYFESDDFPTMTWFDSELTSVIKDLYLMKKSLYWIENNFLYRLNTENQVKTSASGLDNTILHDLTSRSEITKIAICGNSSIEEVEETLLNPSILYKTYYASFTGANISAIFQKTAYLVVDNTKLVWHDQNRNSLYTLNYNANGLVNCDSLRVDKNVIICKDETKLYFLNYESNEAFRIEDGIWEKYNGTTETLNSGLGWSFYYQNPNYGSFDWTGSTIYGFVTFRTTGYWYGICFSTDHIGFLTNFNQTQEINWSGNRFFIDNENLFFDDGISFYKSLSINGYKTTPIDETAYNVSGTAVSIWKFGPQSATYNESTSGNSTIFYFKFVIRSQIPITFRYNLDSTTNGTTSINGHDYGTTTFGSWQNLVITPSHLIVGENIIQVTFGSAESTRNWNAKLLCTATTNNVLKGSTLKSINTIRISGNNYKIYVNMINCMNVYNEATITKFHITDPTSGVSGTDVHQIISGLNISDFWITTDETLLITTEAAVNKILGYNSNDGTWNTTFDNTILNNNFLGIRK